MCVFKLDRRDRDLNKEIDDALNPSEGSVWKMDKGARVIFREFMAQVFAVFLAFIGYKLITGFVDPHTDLLGMLFFLAAFFVSGFGGDLLGEFFTFRKICQRFNNHHIQ